MADPKSAKICMMTDGRIYLRNDIIIGEFLLHGPPSAELDWGLSPYLFVRPSDWPVIETYLSQHPIGDEIQARMFHIGLYQYVAKRIKSGPDRDRFKNLLRELPMRPATFIGLIEDFHTAVSLDESLLPSLRPQFANTLSSVEFRAQIVNIATKLFTKNQLKFRHLEAKVTLLNTVRTRHARTPIAQSQPSADIQSVSLQEQIERQLGPLRTLDWLGKATKDLDDWVALQSKKQQGKAGVFKDAKVGARRKKKLLKRARAVLRKAENEEEVYNRSTDPSPFGTRVKVEPLNGGTLNHGTQLNLPDVDMSEVVTQLISQLRLDTEQTLG